MPGTTEITDPRTTAIHTHSFHNIEEPLFLIYEDSNRTFTGIERSVQPVRCQHYGDHGPGVEVFHLHLYHNVEEPLFLIREDSNRTLTGTQRSVQPARGGVSGADEP